VTRAATAAAAGRLVAEPRPWPFSAPLDPSSTALMLIDWQHDFCGPGGYVDAMGYDISLTRAGIGPTQRLLERWRARGLPVIHTREGHRPDLSDCHPNKLWRSSRVGAPIGGSGPAGRILVRGEPGWEIVEELRPRPDEPVIDKATKGAFCGTDLDLILRAGEIENLVFTGITTDVCVHTTLREATDLGYECLLLEDCTGATDRANHEATVDLTRMAGGILGAVTTSPRVLDALSG
jgi:nicotinamidase-related amidase